MAGVCHFPLADSVFSTPWPMLLGLSLQYAVRFSINQINQIENVLLHTHKTVQHIQRELMLERGKGKCKIYNTLSQATNIVYNIL